MWASSPTTASGSSSVRVATRTRPQMAQRLHARPQRIFRSRSLMGTALIIPEVWSLPSSRRLAKVNNFSLIVNDAAGVTSAHLALVAEAQRRVADLLGCHRAR